MKTGFRIPAHFGKRVAFPVVAGCMVLAALPVSAAINAYLFLDGLEGRSTSKAGFIDILSYSVGVAAPDPTKTQKAVCSNLSLKKAVDNTSPALFQAALAGRVFGTAMLVYDKPVGTEQQDYYQVTLTNAYVTSLQQSGSNENPVESVALTARTVTISYRPEKDDGTLDNAITATVTCP